jgi:hypothetical protein
MMPEGILAASGFISDVVLGLIAFGIGLIPQAGVALGLALMAREQFPVVGEMIFSTIVATRTALSLARELPEDARE